MEEVRWQRAAVQLDIPFDVQQVDRSGFVWTLLDEARAPSLMSPGAIVITADVDESVGARVVDVVDESSRTVHLEILPGNPLDYAEALFSAAPAEA